MWSLLPYLALAQVVASAATQIAFPTASGNVTLSKPQVVKDGETFDGGFRRYGRNVVCAGNGKDVEGGDDDAVFIIEGSGVLKNVIIGEDAIEGVHCTGSCRIESVFWENVCEDALSLVGTADRTVTVKNSAARGAVDKVIQHNSPGTVNVDGFTVDGFSKLYRSCGNCKTQFTRKANFNNIYARNGGILAGVNSNYGDVVTLSNLDMYTTSASKLCEIYTGNNKGAEPTKVSSGPDGTACILSTGTALSPSPSASKNAAASKSPSANASRSPSPSAAPASGSTTATASFKLAWRGGTGWGATVKVTSTKACSSWSVSFDLVSGLSVKQAWNSVLSSSGQTFTFKSVSYNSLTAGGSASFGFNGVRAKSSQEVTTPTNWAFKCDGATASVGSALSITSDESSAVAAEAYGEFMQEDTSNGHSIASFSYLSTTVIGVLGAQALVL